MVRQQNTALSYGYPYLKHLALTT